MPFPSVPDVPGVPALPRPPGFAAEALVLLTTDAVPVVGGSQLTPQWGVYLGGQQVLLPDTIVSFDYKQEWHVSDYPLEKGAFENYDKVATPFEVRVRMSRGGAVADRQAFLSAVASIAGTLDLYDVLTPEQTYKSVNVTHYDYRRTAAAGAGLLVVDLWLVEVRVTVQADFSSTQQPSGASPVGTGLAQTLPATRGQEAIAGIPPDASNLTWAPTTTTLPFPGG